MSETESRLGTREFLGNVREGSGGVELVTLQGDVQIETRAHAVDDEPDQVELELTINGATVHASLDPATASALADDLSTLAAALAEADP